MKQRRFLFVSGFTSQVGCLHCNWTSRGRGNAQRVFDRSRDHECEGVESYQDMLARHAAERDQTEPAIGQPVRNGQESM